MGCTPSILSDNNQNRKDSGLFCVNIGGSSNNQSNINDNDTTGNSICNQLLVNSHQNQKDISSEKAYMKKDSIVSVTGLGHLAGFSAVQTVVRRTTGSGASSTSGRLGHRKSSLALTPEEEPLDTPTPKPLADIKYQHLLPPNPVIRALLVFHKNDGACEALTNACLRLSYETKVCKNVPAAVEAFQNPMSAGYHLVIVDARHPRHIDPEVIGSSLRNSRGSQYTTFVAVVKKSAYERDDSTILSLIDAGYSRCIIETPNASVCNAELLQIHHSLIRAQNVLSTQQAIYAALHRSKQAVIITDDVLRVQYVNKAVERLLNMKQDEIISRPLADFFSSDVSSILTQTHRQREFDGILSIKRKTQEIVTLHIRAVPVVCVGRNPTHLVISIDSPSISTDILPTISQSKEAPRGSLHSIRRGSFDVRSVGSDGLRRTSLAKLSALPLEAPITKVIALLSQVQENCSADEAKLLDRVMEFLKREGLYSAQLKEIKADDPTASDLIGALLSQGNSNVLSSRRSSNDSITRVSRTSNAAIPVVKAKVSAQIMDLLDTALNWDFDIFKLEEITEKRPLMYLGMELCQRFDVFETFNIDESTMKAWLIVIEANYQSSNSYHNSCHAADVMQATAAFLQQLSVKEPNVMDRMDEATALIAAATHDIDHPGRSSAFLCNSDNVLALLYNDICVLESHHAAMTFRLTLRDEKINIFKNLDRENYKLARSIIIDMILATEMTRHFEHLAKFVGVFGNDVAEGKEMITNEGDDNQILIRRMLIKCADVSNPTRPLSFCVEWARRIADEYFNQTDDEKKRNLPIVMPMFDRATCSISKSQIGFIEYIIQDMMNAWDGFIDMPEIIQYMQYNYSQWKLFEEQGIHTLSDIKAKYDSLN